jgi:transposase-like protein
MLPPNNTPVKDLVKKYEIHEQTLYKWRKEAKRNGAVIQNGNLSKEKYSKETQFQIIIETNNMNEHQLSEYCRQKGLYVEEIEAWKSNMIKGNDTNESELKKELKSKEAELKKTKKELDRKEKALAEAAALLVLQKKMQAIWSSDNEED